MGHCPAQKPLIASLVLTAAFKTSRDLSWPCLRKSALPHHPVTRTPIRTNHSRQHGNKPHTQVPTRTLGLPGSSLEPSCSLDPTTSLSPDPRVALPRSPLPSASAFPTLCSILGHIIHTRFPGAQHAPQCRTHYPDSFSWPERNSQALPPPQSPKSSFPNPRPKHMSFSPSSELKESFHTSWPFPLKFPQPLLLCPHLMNPTFCAEFRATSYRKSSSLLGHHSP